MLVASPGRLLDHLRKTQSFKVKSLRVLVLDEVIIFYIYSFDSIDFFDIYSGWNV